MNSLFDLTGKTALITGGGTGIGYGCALGLAEAGATVILASRSDKVDRTAERMRAQGFKVHALHADMSEGEPACIKLAREALELADDRIDILINSAGTSYLCMPEEFPADKFNMVMTVNLDSVFYMCREIGRNMLRYGAGKIINIASMLSFFGALDSPAYASSKGAVVQLTKTLSNAWSSKGIQVNAIAPGYIETELSMMRIRDRPDIKENTRQRIPCGRWGVPEDFKGIAVFLSSPASEYLTGAIIPVDGGYLVK